MSIPGPDRASSTPFWVPARQAPTLLRSGHHSAPAQPLRRPEPHTALHTVVQIRIQYQQSIRDYVARRTAEAKTSREIKRCLARYVARDLCRLLESGARAA
jgi:hypothetical protein